VPPREVSLAEASIITGLSSKALRERIYRGSLPARKQGGQYRIAWKDLRLAKPRESSVETRLGDIERRLTALERQLKP
jgi:hypothetical protein